MEVDSDLVGFALFSKSLIWTEFTSYCYIIKLHVCLKTSEYILSNYFQHERAGSRSALSKTFKEDQELPENPIS